MRSVIRATIMMLCLTATGAPLPFLPFDVVRSSTAIDEFELDGIEVRRYSGGLLFPYQKVDVIRDPQQLESLILLMREMVNSGKGGLARDYVKVGKIVFISNEYATALNVSRSKDGRWWEFGYMQEGDDFSYSAVMGLDKTGKFDAIMSATQPVSIFNTNLVIAMLLTGGLVFFCVFFWRKRAQAKK
jgi:hypothetical protein